MLFEKIKQDRIQAMKDSDKVKFAILGVVVGEIQRTNLGDVPDADVMKVLKKLLEGVESILTVKPDDEKANTEKQVLSSYLPKQLSEEELLVIMKDIISKDASMSEKKNMFPYLKKNYAGQYDGSVANKLFGTL